MTSYPYISSLFTTILSKSKSIEGRFYVCPKGGYEINSDVLGQVLEQVNVSKKYPLVLMMPARMTGDYKLNKGDWVSYNITLFFLKTTYYGVGNVINPNTNTSVISIQDDWASMQTLSVSFFKVLHMVQKQTFYNDFRLGISKIPTQPVSEIGIDRASGVRCDFELQLPYGCEPLADYEESEISSIQIPGI